MSKPLKTLGPVGESYAATGAIEVRRAMKAPAKAVWAALLDAQAWTEWLPITKVTWTSGQPFGVGTTRTVEIGSAVVEEVFFAWDEGARMAFRFDRTSLPVKAAIEDYRVVPTAEGCELVWRGKASAPLGLGWLIGRQLASGIRAGLPKLEALIAADPRRFGAD